jgi:hypothetical protein
VSVTVPGASGSTGLEGELPVTGVAALTEDNPTDANEEESNNIRIERETSFREDITLFNNSLHT